MLQKLELTENEQIIYDIISKRKLMDLVELKDLCGLSNKQWDKGIKSLGKQNITKVVKTDAGLTVEYIQYYKVNINPKASTSLNCVIAPLF